MADKQLARSEAPDFGILSDDDPLSELARIVGYDNRPAVQQLQELEKHRESVRFDPVMDLEDELMREFEAYDTPLSEPHRQEAVEQQPQVEVAPHIEHSVEAPTPLAAEPEAVYIEPQPEPAAAPVGSRFEMTAPVEQAPEAESVVADSREMPVLEAASFEDDAAFDDIDLERELELSIGYDDHQPSADDVPADMTAWEAPLIEQAALPVATPQVIEPADVEPVYSVQVVPESIPQPVAPQSIPQLEDVAMAASLTAAAPFVAASRQNDSDSLLSDIEQYPVPEKAPVRSSVAPETARKNNYPFTPTFSRATPVASNGGSSSQRAFAMPLAAAAPVVVAPALVEPFVPSVSETLVPPVDRPASVIVEAAPALQPVADADFDLDNFELDLSDIELDFDAVDLSDPEIAPVAPVIAAAPFVSPAPIDVVQDYAPELVFDEPVEETNESVLPFDPAMISETEETVTAISDLNVPHLPVVEQEQPIAHQPDYDLDIDAEMAQLFGTVDHSQNQTAGIAAAAAVSGAAGVAALRGNPEKPAVADDFDEFERAMEEDFRRSLSQRREADAAAANAGGGYATEYSNDDDARRPRRRWALLAAAVAGIAIIGGAGVYAFTGGSGSLVASGEPKIILADKTPVKMVPVEKGGKTVPNQDKAVYDRVAGAQDQTPQQGTLVSSTEEPIDVVQRTLTPESLPLEGRADGEAGMTPVDDEGSDRLLPDAAAEDFAAADDGTPAVSPRKVRTMIVKPDGTLVAREEPVAPTQSSVASTGTVAAPQETASLDTLRQQEPAATEPQSALAQAASADVDETAPVRNVKTTPAVTPVAVVKPVEPAPIEATTAPATAQPTARPAVTEAAPTTEVKPIQTASITPGSYVVQIASLPSEAEAQKSYNTLSGKFGVIAGKGVDIRKAEIAGKGTYYRVRIPAGTRDEANALCSKYKSAGGSCLVTR